MRTVYFFTSPTCGACEEWKPTVDAFVQANLNRMIVLRCNPNLREYKLSGWKVKYTPSVAVMENGQLLRKAEGQLMDAAELEAFVFGATWKPASKKGASKVDESKPRPKADGRGDVGIEEDDEDEDDSIDDEDEDDDD